MSTVVEKKDETPPPSRRSTRSTRAKAEDESDEGSDDDEESDDDEGSGRGAGDLHNIAVSGARRAIAPAVAPHHSRALGRSTSANTTSV